MMNDLIIMIGNLSQSLLPLQAVLSILAYIIGFLLFMAALSKLRSIGDARARSSSQEKLFVPAAYFLGGAALFFLPSAIRLLSNTAFGPGNILQYANYSAYDFYGSIKQLIRFIGLIWFMRGAVLLAHSSEPGVKHGSKGLAFLCAGILAINFQGTVGFLNTIMTKLSALAS